MLGTFNILKDLFFWIRSTNRDVLDMTEYKQNIINVDDFNMTQYKADIREKFPNTPVDEFEEICKSIQTKLDKSNTLYKTLNEILAKVFLSTNPKNIYDLCHGLNKQVDGIIEELVTEINTLFYYYSIYDFDEHLKMHQSELKSKYSEFIKISFQDLDIPREIKQH